MGLIEQQLINELKSAGFKFQDIDHLYRQRDFLPLKACKIILKWLPDVYKEHIGSGECLVRSLLCPSDPFDPAILISLFENSDLNDTLKCTIGYVLSIANTKDIREWLLHQLLDKEHSFARTGLLDGIVPKGGFKTKNELKEFLFQIFDKYSCYEIFQKLVQKYSSTEDIPFIEQKAIEADSKRKSRELLKVADRIRTRKRIPKFP
ncbi:MAG: hypothetical protein Q8941_22115 [Bacteroidota bacterium]|nr:hypothetical protein [Bacteroidota bacterium]